MIDIVKDDSLRERDISFGLVEVSYPEPERWDAAGFYDTAERVIAQLRETYRDYERKAVFGEQPYSRFFKKFKKTYPVMLQFESCLFKGRPFPEENPITGVPFLAELSTLVLMGTHDVDRVQGQIRLVSGTEKAPFSGLFGEAHTYPNDVVGRDGGGIIFSMIAGADDRTCAHPESRHVFYPVFGVPGQSTDTLRQAQETVSGFARILSPDARIETLIL